MAINDTDILGGKAIILTNDFAIFLHASTSPQYLLV